MSLNHLKKLLSRLRRLSRNQRIALITVALLAFGLSFEPALQFAESVVVDPGYYSVVQVNDGDTIIVNMDGRQQTIRFIGVDTPETHHPSKPVQCFGQAASNFTTNLLEGQQVRLESDPLSSNRDRYNRLLRYVYTPDGTLVNQQLVAEGYGFAYVSFPFSKMDDFIASEQQARQQNRGLWDTCTPELDDGHLQTQGLS